MSLILRVKEPRAGNSSRPETRAGFLTPPGRHDDSGPREQEPVLQLLQRFGREMELEGEEPGPRRNQALQPGVAKRRKVDHVGAGDGPQDTLPVVAWRDPDPLQALAFQADGLERPLE